MQTKKNTSHLRDQFMQLQISLNKQILGQKKLVDSLLIAVLADGHLLVEGAPGLAKTRAVKALAAMIEGDFHRIQFTPDLLPGDLTGTDIYHPEDGSFVFQPGPIFHHLILADEINRAPAKVQSALLEAMAERQVTMGRKTYPLPELFLVMATQNPIEQEGTYPLPEAQLDRFLMYVKIDYPEGEVERDILHLVRSETLQQLTEDSRLSLGPTNTTENHALCEGRGSSAKSILTQSMVFAARREALQVHMSDALEQYLVDIVIGTRKPQLYQKDLARWLMYGASPRATVALDRCAKAHAFLAGRDFVTPEDIHIIAHDVLRHRVLLTFEAEAEGINSDNFIDRLLNLIAIP